jgi:hypothetical protein
MRTIKNLLKKLLIATILCCLSTIDIYATSGTQASGITFSNIASTSMTISWTNGSGVGRIVAMHEGAGAITNPTNYINYSASANWSSKGDQLGTSGYYIVYKGTGNTVDVTNLVTDNTYYIQVFEILDGMPNYNITTETGNPNSVSIVSKTAQTITFADLPTKYTGDPDFSPGATATSGLTVTYASNNEFVATIVSGKIHIVGDGISDITASQAGDATYAAAPDVTKTLTVYKKNQTITFGALPAKAVGDADFYPGATTNATGLTVSYTSSDPSVATIISNEVIRIIGVGSTVITAKQAGNAIYYAATDVPQTLTVSLKTQTITFGPLPSKIYGDGNFSAGASTDASGLTLSYESSDHAVATINAEGTIHIVGAGSANITASQAGDATYGAASVTQALTINKKPLSVTNANAANKEYDGNTNASISGANLVGVVGSDAITLTGATSGTFNSEDVGTGKTVTTFMSITGVGTGNYLFSPPTLTANITAKTLTVNAVADNKQYDGTTAATISGATLVGVVNPDDVTLTGASSGTFDSKNIGDAKPVTTNMEITGADIGNYRLTQPTLTANITAKELTVNADVSNKIYDGNTAAVITDATLVGVINSEVSLINATTGTFATKDAGNAIAIATAMNITGLTGNYTLTQPTLKANINKAPLTITAADASRVYGASNPEFTGTITGFVNGEDASVFTSPLIYTCAADAGTNASTTTPIVPSGMAAVNYSFTLVNGTLTITKAIATITLGTTVFKGDGAPKPVIATTVPGGLTYNITYNGSSTAPSALGVYDVVATINETNYQGSVTGMLTITDKTIATVSISNNDVVYNGSPRAVTTSTDPVGKTVVVTYENASYTKSTVAPTNAGIYSVFAIINDNSYAGSVSGILTIAKVPLTVTAENKSKTYGALNPTFTSTITGYINNENASVITGSVAYTCAATIATAVGTSQIAPNISGLSATNYSFNAVNGTLTINKAILTVTADNTSKVYGAANPAFGGTITGMVNEESSATAYSGVAAYTCDAIATSPVGISVPIVAAVGTLSSSNYDFRYVNGVLSITKASLTVTANDASRVYGDENPAFSSAITGFVNGETVSVVSGSAAYACAATLNSPVGTPVTIAVTEGTLSTANYNFTFVNGTLSITKSPLTATGVFYYGATSPTVVITGYKNSETASVLSAIPTATISGSEPGVTSPVGTPVDIIVDLKGATADNYNVIAVNGTAVSKTILTVTANNTSKLYGAANPAFSCTYTGFVNGESTSSISGSPSYACEATVSSIAGIPVPIVISVNTLSSSNYTFALVNGFLTINPAPITVTANNATKVYGTINPSFTSVVSGAQNEEIITVTYTCTANLSTAVGTSTPIVPSVSNTNYTVTSAVNGVLSITQAPLTVTANAKSKIYGAENPIFTGVVSGANLGETFSVSYTCDATVTTGVGTSSIIPAITGSTIANYNVTLVNGTLTITPATLKVTANNATKTYGAVNPAFTSDIVGAKNGDNISVEYTCAANNTTVVGTTISIVPSVSNANYTVTAVNGKLTINKATLTVTASNATKFTGTANPTFTGTVTGFVNGESAAVAYSGTIKYKCAATTKTGVGTSPIIPDISGLTSANYSFVAVNGTLTITKAPNSVDVLSTVQLKIYPTVVCDFVNLEATSNIKSVQIVSIDGKSILSEKFNSSTVILDVALLKNGIYLLNVISDEGIATRRIFVSK